MALIWKKHTRDTLYEVRAAGNTLRLYTNGVFHTQYNPRNPLTGHIWDLLMLPAFFHSLENTRRVLVLGVGGGAVIQLLKKFVQPEHIVGVELNPEHVGIARRFFGLKKNDVHLITADAVRWIQTYRGEKFDLIIDDLFMEVDGEPEPVVVAGAGWFRSLLRHLSPTGTIVRNFVSKADVQESAGLADAATSARFASVFQLTTRYNENFSVAYLRRPSTGAELRKRLIQTPGLNPNLKTSRLRYRLRRLK